MLEIYEESKILSKANRQKQRMNNFKEIFIEWSKKVDINCYAKMLEYGPNYRVQFIWLIILLGSTGATFYFISKSIIDYLNYDVVSQTNIISEIPTDFPTVTFCDNNQFSTKYSQQSLEYAIKNNKSFFTLWLKSDEELKKFGFEYNQIMSCTFMYENCLNDLHWYWSNEYGNCWQFNSGFNLTNQKVSLKQSSSYGPNFGLSIEIFPLFNNNDYYYRSRSIGMIVFIHNSTFRPSTTKAYIEPGKMSNIEIARTFIQKSPYPFSDCIDLDSYSSDLYDYMKNTGHYSYRQEDCFELCLQKNVIDECQCYSLFLENLSSPVGPCLPQEKISCSLRQYLSYDLSECKTKSCPLECETVKYDLYVTTQVYPDVKYYKYSLNTETTRNLSFGYLNESLTYDLMREYSLAFNVYYPFMRYTLLTESPKTSIADLFSQIGGGLGLFVSFSVFTLFEFIEIFILVIFGLFFKTPSNSVSNQE
jgi:hypothetical protein